MKFVLRVFFLIVVIVLIERHSHWKDPFTTICGEVRERDDLPSPNFTMDFYNTVKDLINNNDSLKIDARQSALFLIDDLGLDNLIEEISEDEIPNLPNSSFQELDTIDFDITMGIFEFGLCKWTDVNRAYEKASNNVLHYIYYYILDKVNEMSFPSYQEFRSSFSELYSEEITLYEEPMLLRQRYNELTSLYDRFLGKNSSSSLNIQNDRTISAFKERRIINNFSQPMLGISGYSQNNDAIRNSVNNYKVKIDREPTQIEMINSYNLLYDEVFACMMDYQMQMTEEFRNRINMKNLLKSEYFKCDKDSSTVKVTYVTKEALKAKLASIAKTNSEKKELQSLLSEIDEQRLFGAPYVDQDGQRRAIVSVKRHQNDKKDMWFLLPFVVFHEIAHHELHNVETYPPTKKVGDKDDFLSQADEKNADCHAITYMLKLQTNESSEFARRTINCFEKIRGSGLGTHPSFYERYEFMQKCFEDPKEDQIPEPGELGG